MIIPGIMASVPFIKYMKETKFAAVAVDTAPYVTMYDIADWSKITLPFTPLSVGASGVDFSPDGRYLLVSYYSVPFGTSSGGFRVYDLTTGNQVTTVSGLANNTTGYRGRFNKSGSKFAVPTNATPSLAVFDTASWSMLPNSPSFTGGSTGCDWSPDGTMLAGVTGSSPPKIRVFDSETMTEIVTGISAPVGGAVDCAFSWDNQYLAVTMSDVNNLAIYETNTWGRIYPSGVGGGGAGQGCAFSRDNRFFVMTHQQTPFFSVFDVGTWQQLPNPTVLPAASGVGCDFTNDSSMLIIGLRNDPYIAIYDTSNWLKLPNPGVLPGGGTWDVSFD